MGAINRWSALICMTSMACVLIEFLIPPGKISKVMNMVLGLFMLCVIITPFTSGKKMFDFDFNEIKKQNTLESKSSFTNKVNSQLESMVESNISGIVSGVLKDIGIVSKKVEIFMDKKQDNCISIIKCRVYIDEKDSDLAEIIKNEVENKLKIGTEVVKGEIKEVGNG